MKPATQQHIEAIQDYLAEKGKGSRVDFERILDRGTSLTDRCICLLRRERKIHVADWYWKPDTKTWAAVYALGREVDMPRPVGGVKHYPEKIKRNLVILNPKPRKKRNIFFETLNVKVDEKGIPHNFDDLRKLDSTW